MQIDFRRLSTYPFLLLITVWFFSFEALALQSSLVPSPGYKENIPANSGSQESISSPLSQLQSREEHRNLKLSRVIRDSGVGLALGGVAGLSFAVMAQGRLPDGSNQRGQEALATGLVAGVLGGIITGLWEAKNNPELALPEASTK